jgi:peptide/nickel transport system substrate-binding protein
MTLLKAAAVAALVGLFALVLAACGSSSSKVAGTGAFNTAGFANPLSEPLTGGKRGGTLNVLSETDFEHLDPGIAYFSVDYTVVFATQRPLYSFKPNQQSESTPDLASGKPEVSNNGKVVTVHLREGIHYSPPVNREVTAEDVAYAIERGKNPNVANPYVESYFKAIEGMPTATGGPIKGIETPNKHTIVFHLTEAKPVFVSGALVLPLTAPVPKEYAEKFDKNKPSNYGAFEVATGPYMLKNDKSGKVLGVGYTPGKEAILVRNPNWNAATDFRPRVLG